MSKVFKPYHGLQILKLFQTIFKNKGVIKNILMSLTKKSLKKQKPREQFKDETEQDSKGSD
jgi:hypothetical protein